MKLVLMRHAQKGITPYEDPDLTEVGFLQAQNLCHFAECQLIPTPTHAWVSPKVRTAQTLKPLCDSYRVTLQIAESLDLRSSSESSADFRKRISQFLNQFYERAEINKAETHYLCTHYDWIEEGITLINSDKDLNSFEFSHWAPGQFLIFELQNSVWKFIKKGTANATKTD